MGFSRSIFDIKPPGNDAPGRLSAGRPLDVAAATAASITRSSAIAAAPGVNDNVGMVDRLDGENRLAGSRSRDHGLNLSTGAVLCTKTIVPVMRQPEAAASSAYEPAETRKGKLRTATGPATAGLSGMTKSWRSNSRDGNHGSTANQDQARDRDRSPPPCSTRQPAREPADSRDIEGSRSAGRDPGGPSPHAVAFF